MQDILVEIHIIGAVEKIIIRNSYNVGTIVAKNIPTRGAIIGNIGNSEEQRADSQNTNNYWLDTCGASYGNGAGPSDATNNTGSEPRTAEEIKGLANNLGDKFEADDKDNLVNDGYPILKWQKTLKWQEN